MQLIASRRQFLSTASAALATMFLPRLAHAARLPHPTPRPGITGANVLTKAQLAGKPKLIPLFDSMREMAEVADGIRCNCQCEHPPAMYSLLSCYEGDGMARDCAVCQGQGRLVARLHKAGKTLDEIRTAVDAKFG